MIYLFIAAWLLVSQDVLGAPQPDAHMPNSALRGLRENEKNDLIEALLIENLRNSQRHESEPSHDFMVNAEERGIAAELQSTEFMVNAEERGMAAEPQSTEFMVNAEERGMAAEPHCEATTVKSFFGLEFTLSGYNILYGYPAADNRDPGWRSPIFQANFDKPRYTSDCSYLLPLGVDMQRTVACSTSFSSETAKSESSYSSELSASASIKGGGWGASFAASGSYKKAIDKMEQQDTIFTMSEAKCLYYTSLMSPGLPPPLTTGFIQFIKALENDDTGDKYFDFFDHYGTHFVSSIDYGAKYTRTHSMNKQAYNEISSSSFSVEVTAGYEGVYSISGSAKLTGKQKEAVDQFRQLVTTTTATIGALPDVDGNSDKWASEVKDTPAPTAYQLQSIDQIFTSTYFRGVSDIDYEKIKKKIETYKELYCQELKKRGTVSSCAEPEEPMCHVPTVKYGTVACYHPSGSVANTVRDKDICYLTCDADPLVSSVVNGAVVCNVFGNVARFNATPSCKTYDLMYLQSSKGVYQLTPRQGSDMCALNKARMATYDELKAAYNQGFARCACGWVMNGNTPTGMYPMQSAHKWCGNKVGILTCTWAKKWDVWCHPLS